MFVRATIRTAVIIFFGTLLSVVAAAPGRVQLAGHVPAVVSRLSPLGRLPATNNLSLAIGLPLRNQTELDELIRQLYDPGSTNYHKFLAPAEFAARFGPTEADYAAVKNYALTNGFNIVGTHGNRLVLDVQAKAADVERAFQVNLRTFRHPSEARDFFAPDVEPSVPANLQVVDMWGLSDYPTARPQSHKIDPLKIKPLGGSGPNGLYAGNDFRNAYMPGIPASLNGAGQSVGLLEFSDYFYLDITNYENTIGLTNYVPVNTVQLPGGSPSTANNGEVALDIEVAIAMAPGLSQVLVYEIKSVNPSSILSRMANDNLAKQLSSSWTWSGGPSTTVDNIFKQMASQGQSYFQASGDSDAYTGSQILDNASQINSPVGSTNITAVGGTTLTMNGSGASWSSETVWNYHNYGGTYANEGSGGGVCSYYKLPYWQSGISTNANLGSMVWRNVPDVALTADQIYVAYNNGSSGGFAGTSCAAPLWAGFCALVNQFDAATNGTTVGFVNPILYNIAASSCYSKCFHDITTGNNIGTNTAGLYYAVAGYDLCTGLGTPNGTNLMNALVWPPPTFTSQPAGKIVTNGAAVTFSAAATSTTPLAYFWLCNGTNLAASTNIFGVHSNALSIASAATNNSGSYQLIASNMTGSVTSSVAVLNVGFAPLVTTPPTNVTQLVGSNVAFSVVASGSATLAYQWKRNGTNFAGTGITGTNASTLAISTITTNSGANYSVVVTNLFGVVTSSVASLTVVLPPSMTGSLTNRTLQCGSNVTYTVAAAGTSPLFVQWNLDGSAIPGATNSTLTLTNVHLPNHSVGVVITNLYASLASNAVLSVNDTLAPAIALAGGAFLTNELGAAFSDPGASAYDLCAGVVPVTASGTVNTSVVGTNTLTYKAADGNGNTNTLTRTVIVRDTTPPTILWSFTNLVMAANTNCAAAMPDVTGTNFILATDLSGALTITQNLTNGAVLPLGTNGVVITVADASGNKSYSTNLITVTDQTPPVITLNGPNPMTNELGVAFMDPGMTASDACSGIVLLSTNGTVNVNAVGTNFVTYAAVDGSGNTNLLSRAVIVCDTTPPAILWRFTNLVLVADSNCVALMPDVTGTNCILAADLSEPLTFSQDPTNAAILFAGTNSVVITVRDAFGNAAYSTNEIVVRDLTPPAVTLAGAATIFAELGQAFTDPGATAVDACDGVVPVTVSGTVDTGAIGTNVLTYTAADSQGNTNAVTRTVIVRDTMPPVISWAVTNLELTLDTNCSATMPDVTGTNFIVATDWSGPLTATQSPTNGAPLSAGTNVVIIAVADAFSNTAYATNFVFVRDPLPPLFLGQPQSQTNDAGTAVVFNAAATACTPLAFQWFCNGAMLTNQTADTITLSNLTSVAAGNYYVVATSGGGSSTSAVAALTINLLTSSLTLTSSANPSGFKSGVDFIAAVTPANASGTIQFLTNGLVFDLKTLVAGSAVSTNLATLPRGTQFITAIYSGDTTFLPVTNSIEQVVTNHPPQANPVACTNTLWSPLVIAVTNLATHWSDVDGDAVSLVDVGISTNGIVVTNEAGFLTYFNSNNVPDQFVCTIADGFGGTNYQTVDILAAPLPDATPLITGVVGISNGVLLSLAGAPGRTYILERTAELFPAIWLPIATNTLGTNGVWQFTDTPETNSLQGYFRLQLVP